MIYRSLYVYGALKYVIANSLVRYDADYINKSIPPTSEHLIQFLIHCILKTSKANINLLALDVLIIKYYLCILIYFL